MIHQHIDRSQPKGWLVGPWNSAVNIPIGYANEGIAIEHYHAQMYEVYLVAQGQAVAFVDGVEVELTAGDMLVVEPNEVHTFGESSADYFHFVIQTPFVKGDKVEIESVGKK